MFSKCYILCKDVSVDEAVFALYSQPRSGMLCSVVASLCTFVTVLSNDGAAWWLSVNQDAYETDLITKKKSGIIQLFLLPLLNQYCKALFEINILLYHMLLKTASSAYFIPGWLWTVWMMEGDVASQLTLADLTRGKIRAQLRLFCSKKAGLILLSLVSSLYSPCSC